MSFLSESLSMIFGEMIADKFNAVVTKMDNVLEIKKHNIMLFYWKRIYDYT